MDWGEVLNQNQSTYQELREGLRRRYDEWRSYVEDREDLRNECRDGNNFVRTLDLVVKLTGNPQATRSTYLALYAAANRPNGGTISWEMRRFIRRANVDQIIKLADLVSRGIKINPEFRPYFETVVTGEADPGIRLMGLEKEVERKLY